MATDTHSEDMKHLFDLIKDIKFAMLTTVDDGGSLRSRPMANRQAETFDGALWFFTHASAHKTEEVRREHQVNVSFADPDSQNYVSISGTAELSRDQAKIDELWTPVTKAWFPKGKDDADTALLKITIAKAEFWDAPSGAMAHLIGLAKGAVTGDHKVGENKKISFG